MTFPVQFHYGEAGYNRLREYDFFSGQVVGRCTREPLDHERELRSHLASLPVAPTVLHVPGIPTSEYLARVARVLGLQIVKITHLLDGFESKLPTRNFFVGILLEAAAKISGPVIGAFGAPRVEYDYVYHDRVHFYERHLPLWRGITSEKNLSVLTTTPELLFSWIEEPLNLDVGEGPELKMLYNAGIQPQQARVDHEAKTIVTCRHSMDSAWTTSATHCLETLLSDADDLR